MKNILQIIVIVLTMLFTSNNSKAAIVYTDINPDSISTSTSAGLTIFGAVDMDNDTNPELAFAWFSFGPSWTLQAVPTVQTTKLFYLAANTSTNLPAYNSLAPLNVNDVISNNPLFSDTGQALLSDPTVFNNFMTAGDKYIGVEFQIGTNTHYGWVLVNLSSTPAPATLTIKSYAYESNPNTQILAGDTGSATPVIMVNNITVNSLSATITTNAGTMQMTANILPVNATNSTVTWSVNNGNATISNTGLLTAVSNGTVIVTATANDGSNVTGTKTITISNQIVLVDSINVTSTGNTINTMAGTMQMTANVLPMNATNSTVTWSVDNGNATIDNAGLLTAVANGTVIVTATANDGSNVSDTKTIFLTNQTALSVENKSANNIKIYPNPAQSYILIEGMGSKNLKYQIYNMQGAILVPQSILTDNKIIVDFLPTANYIIQLSDRDSDKEQFIHFIKI